MKCNILYLKPEKTPTHGATISMESQLKDKLGAILQNTVLSICKNVVPFSEALVIENSLSVEADNKQVCTLSFKQVVDAKDPCISNSSVKSAREPYKASILTNMEPPSSYNPQTGSESYAKSCSNEFKTPGSRPLVITTTPSPKNSSLSTMQNLTGSRQSLVDTLVAEAMKIWYDEGSSPERLHEMRKEYASDAHKAAAVELGLEAIDQYGQISPETLEAAAQLRRLREQPPLTFTPLTTAPQSHQPVSQQENKEPSFRTRHSRKQKLEVNQDFETPKKTRGKSRSENDCQEYLTPMKNDNGMYQCPVCAKEFTFATNLTRHQRNFHGRPYSRKTKDKVEGNNQSEITQGTIHIKNFEKTFGSMDHQGSVTAIGQGSDGEGVMATETGMLHSDHTSADSSSEAALSEQTLTPDDDDFSGDMLGGSETGSSSGDVDSGKELPPPLKGRYKYVSIATEPAPKYNCSLCDRKFPHYRNLGRHLKVAHALSVCEYEMTSKDDCCQQDSGNTGPHKCKLCGHQFTFPSNLYRHMNKVHKHRPETGNDFESQQTGNCDKEVTLGQGILTCDLCPTKFTLASNLARHVRQVHKMMRVPVSRGDGDECGKTQVDEARMQVTDEVSVSSAPSSLPKPALLVSSILHSTPAPHYVASQPVRQLTPSSIPPPYPLIHNQPYTPHLPSSSPGLHSTGGPAIPHSNPARSQPAGLPPLPKSPILLPHFSNADLLSRGYGVSSLSHHDLPLQHHSFPPPYPHNISPTSSSLSTDVSPSSALSHSADSTPPQHPTNSSPQMHQLTHNGYNQHMSGSLSHNNMATHCIPSEEQQPSAVSALATSCPSFPSDIRLPDPPLCNESLSCPVNEVSPTENARGTGVPGKKYRCQVCCQRFTLRTNLVRHIKNVHKQTSPSSDADLKSSPPSNLRKAQNKPNSTCVPLKIPVLPLSTRTSNLITPSSRKKKHRTAPASAASKCKKSPPSSPRHRHTCGICGNAFTFRTNLTRHMRIQHKQVPDPECSQP